MTTLIEHTKREVAVFQRPNMELVWNIFEVLLKDNGCWQNLIYECASLWGEMEITDGSLQFCPTNTQGQTEICCKNTVPLSDPEYHSLISSAATEL